MQNLKVMTLKFINSLRKFEFIIGISSLSRLLHPVTDITQKLQGRTIDIIDTSQNIDTCNENM